MRSRLDMSRGIPPQSHLLAELLVPSVERFLNVSEPFKYCFRTDCLDVGRKLATAGCEERGRVSRISNESRMNFRQGCFSEQLKCERSPQLILLGVLVCLGAKATMDVNLRLGVERIALQSWIRCWLHRIEILRSFLSESKQSARPRPWRSRQLSMTSTMPACQ